MLVEQKTNIFFILCIGMSILGYIIPVHSPYGHDFLTNALSFALIAIGCALWVFKQKPQFFSISILTWLSLAVVILMQPTLNHIRYPDALIFPVLCLFLVALASTIASNIQDKTQFLNVLSGFVYVTLIITFAIQVMQVFDYQITWHNWPVTRLAAIDGRMDGNFGQTNHTAYAFVLGICFALYQIHNKPWDIQKFALLGLFGLFVVGIALTKSRANVIMAVAAILVFYFSQAEVLSIKIKKTVAMLVLFFGCYVGGGLALAQLAPYEVSVFGAVSRINEGGFYDQRLSLVHRAWLIFQDSPVVGAGWTNYIYAGIPHAEELKWFTFSNDAHMVIFQIASELGILGLLCLLPLILVLFRALHFKHSTISAMALAFVVASILYSFSEYPLWYFRYLVVFAIFIALIEQKQYRFPKLTSSIPRTIAAVCVILASLSVYYSYNYLNSGYLFYQYNLDTKKIGADGKVHDNYEIPIFGFTNYGEMNLSSVISVDQSMLSEKLGLFDRILIMDFSQYNVFSYGRLLVYDNQSDKALTMFKTSCLLTSKNVKCENATLALYNLAMEDPDNFVNIYNEYVTWLKSQKIN